MSIFFQYILVVLATDHHDNNVDPPMEIVVLVGDVNDNAPQCGQEETIFEVQEQEPIGKLCVCVYLYVCMCFILLVNHCISFSSSAPFNYSFD